MARGEEGGCALVKKPAEEKYRRFTGRRGAPNTGKVIEIAKEKARPLNWRVTGAETGKTGQINRAIAPVAGGSTPRRDRRKPGNDAAREPLSGGPGSLAGLWVSLGAQFPD
jgi:hypothetical protein